MIALSIWESETAARRNNDPIGGCLGIALLFFLALAFISHIFVKGGDIIYYPFQQNMPFTSEYKVESWLREVFGTRYIRNIPDRDFSFFAGSSQRKPMVRDVQRIEDNFYGARLFLEIEPLVKQYEKLLKSWREDEWRSRNIDRVFLENVCFNTLFLKKDLERNPDEPLLAYLLSNNRITINKAFSDTLRSESKYTRENAQNTMQWIRSHFKSFKSPLPPDWGDRNVVAPGLIVLESDLNFNQMIIPFLLLAIILFAFLKNRKKILLEAVADNQTGVKYEDVGNYEKAAEFFRKAAERGNGHAAENLGQLYWEGRGVPQDDDFAARWYKKAAKHGIPSALKRLGEMYDSGRGVPLDRKKAAEYNRRAARKRDARG